MPIYSNQDCESVTNTCHVKHLYNLLVTEHETIT